MKDQSIDQVMKQQDFYVRYIASKYKIESYDYEDLVQEARIVLYKILKDKKHNPKKSKLSTYLMSSIDNHFKNLHDKRTSDKMLIYSTGVEGFGKYIDSEVNVDFEHFKFYDEVYKIIESNFSKKLATIVKLKIEGLSLEEIASHFNEQDGTSISKQTVDIMLKRASKPMYRLLKKEGVFDE